MLTEISLDWKGPFHFCSPNNNPDVDPPNSPGVYLWTVGNCETKYISYVGEAGNIRNRLYTHMVYTLGGGYWLYDAGELLSNKTLNPVYKPSPGSWNNSFLQDFSNISEAAYKNLAAFQIFWAVVEGETHVRRMVESCIINKLMTDENQYKSLFQNDRISVKADEFHQIKVVSNFPQGINFYNIDKEIIY